jgi:hypothetical protein
MFRGGGKMLTLPAALHPLHRRRAFLDIDDGVFVREPVSPVPAHAAEEAHHCFRYDRDFYAAKKEALK